MLAPPPHMLQWVRKINQKECHMVVATALSQAPPFCGLSTSEVGGSSRGICVLPA